MIDRSKFTLRVVDTIPDSTYRRGPRNSFNQDVYNRTKASPSGKTMIPCESAADADRVYKSAIQWRTRHKNLGFGIRKDGLNVYFWVDKPTPSIAADVLW